MVTVLKTYFFHRRKLQEKFTLFTLLFYTLLMIYCYVKHCYCSSLPIIHNFHVVLLLANVMFPSQLASNIVNFASKRNGF